MLLIFNSPIQNHKRIRSGNIFAEIQNYTQLSKKPQLVRALHEQSICRLPLIAEFEYCAVPYLHHQAQWLEFCTGGLFVADACLFEGIFDLYVLSPINAGFPSNL